MTNKHLVIKSNFLVEASYRLSAVEQKIILTLSTKIKRDDKEFQKYLFNLGELGEFLGLKTNADYAYLRNVTKSLLTKVLILRKAESTLQTHWLESVEYFDKQGTVALNFNPELKPFLIQLKENFTKYQLKYAIQLKSIFSIRVYELLKQYEKLGHRDFLLEELREKLGIKVDEYPFYGNFKAKVLLVAQRELKTKTDISFTFEEIKVGRGVGKIRFYIKLKNMENEPNTPENVTQPSTIQENPDIEKLTALLPVVYREKESVQKLLKSWLAKRGYDFVARNIEYANDSSNAVNPGINWSKGSNYRNYLAKSLIGDFGLPYKEDLEIKKNAEKADRQKAQEEATAKKKQEENARQERESFERVLIYLQSLTAEGKEQLREEAISRLPHQQQEVVKRKGAGHELMVKFMIDRIALERMKLS